MIELTIYSYLNENLSVPVYLSEPLNPPKNYVLFEKTGSRKQNHLKSSMFAFQSYGESLFETVELNEKVKKVVEQMIELDEIASIQLNSDYKFTDITTKRNRYQAVFDISHY